MAAEVSSNNSLVRVEEQPQIHAGNSDLLITKDLLGSLSKAAPTKETDLEFKNQRCSSTPRSPLLAASSSAASSPDEKSNKKPLLPNWVQDSRLKFMEDMTSPDLKLQYSLIPSHYQSVCTLDKVKNALERAEKRIMKKRSPPSSSSSSTTSPGIMFAAACPGCLFYVMASKTNPKCPHCNSFVPFAMDAVEKKPRIDLNASF